MDWIQVIFVGKEANLTFIDYMVVKKTKQLGNFRRGINIYIPKRWQPITTYANGLYGKRYVGYFNDDVNWFNKFFLF